MEQERQVACTDFLWLFRIRTWIYATTIVCAFGAGSVLALPTHVVVDTSDGHTTTFVSLPNTLPAAEFDKFAANLRGRNGTYLLTWDEFIKAPERHIKGQIRRNDYPRVDIVKGLVLLLARYEGIPFGLTWNGGVAITGNDYRYSADTYAAYLRDPKSAIVLERSRDPVHPENHLVPLLQKE